MPRRVNKKVIVINKEFLPRRKINVVEKCCPDIMKFDKVTEVTPVQETEMIIKAIRILYQAPTKQ